MGDTNRPSSGKKKPILSAKTTRHTCGRPFKAPRPVVQIITETAKDKDIEGRQEDADEVARHGEVSVVKESAISVVKETELQDTTSDSDDNVPVASLLRPKNPSSLTLQQIEECKIGPLGEAAVGKTIAKMFEGVEFRG